MEIAIEHRLCNWFKYECIRTPARCSLVRTIQKIFTAEFVAPCSQRYSEHRTSFGCRSRHWPGSGRHGAELVALNTIVDYTFLINSKYVYYIIYVVGTQIIQVINNAIQIKIKRWSFYTLSFLRNMDFRCLKMLDYTFLIYSIYVYIHIYIYIWNTYIYMYEKYIYIYIYIYIQIATEIILWINIYGNSYRALVM